MTDFLDGTTQRDLMESKQQAAAVQAREAFRELGRGMLIARIVSATDGQAIVRVGGAAPNDDWTFSVGQTIGSDDPSVPAMSRTTTYRCAYIPFAEISEAGGVGKRLVERYNPATQAVVMIEYEPDSTAQPEIVTIRDGNVADYKHGGH